MEHRDEIDKWLYEEMQLIPGSCSSISTLQYNTARAVAEKLWLKWEEPNPEVVSPFTGGKATIETEDAKATFRGEEVTYQHKNYLCHDTGNKYADTEMESQSVWSMFRAYWEKKRFDGFQKDPLTPDDIKKIVDIYDECLSLTFEEGKPAYESEAFYKEVLDRFLKSKQK